MGRWTSLIYYLVLYQYANPQPIKNEGENVRQSRQLDLGECCPCPGSQRSFDQLSATSRRQGIIDSPQGQDDCPCRLRQADSEGASSILIPNAMRAAGTFLKPTEKKEDVKPLLHPEVDLASSVLETLREATNEEYRQALARDAVRDAVKIAGLSDSTFRDAASEESRNIVTIIMNPKGDFEDDGIPQVSHVQESRCINAPLGSTKSKELGKLKVPPTPPLVKETFRLPKSRQPGLMHRNFMDIDSNVGASNLQERVVNVEEEQINVRDTGLFKLTPSTSLINNDRNSDLKSPLISNDLKYPFSSPLFKNNKNKHLGEFPTIPRIRLETSVFGNKNNRVDKNDRNELPSNVEENVLERGNTMIKEITSFRKPTLKNIIENTRPFNLKHLLKLKDVELIPSGTFEKPTTVVQPTLFPLYALSRKNKTEILNQRDKSQVDLRSDRQNNYLKSKMISQNEDCSKETEEKETRNIQIIKKKPLYPETEILDTIPNPSNTVFSFDKGQTISDGCESYETSNSDLNKLVLPTTIHEDESSSEATQTDESYASKNDCETEESHYSRTTSDSENYEPDEIETDEKKNSRTTNGTEIDSGVNDCDTDETQCSRNTSSYDNFTPNCASNFEDNLEPTERLELTEAKTMIPQAFIRENDENIQNNIVETTTTNYKFLKPVPLDKTLLSIKNKIKNTLENLKNINTDIKGLSDQNKYDAYVSSHSHNETQLSEIKIIPDLDCISENPEQLITTLKSIISDDDIENDNKNLNYVTIQELQKKSDSMLQDEVISDKKIAERGQNEKATKDRNPEINEIESENDDSETSANTKSVDVMLPEVQEDDTISNDNSENVANVCESNLSKGISTQKINIETTNRDQKDLTEMDAAASNLVTNKLSQERIRPLGKILEYPFSVDDTEQIPSLHKDTLSVLKTPFPGVRDILKLNNLPTLDDIKLKVSNMFNTNERDVQKDPSQVKHCIRFSPSKSKSSMATDASTANFQVKQPPLRLLDRETLNLDIFQLRPITNPISNLRTPTFDLNSYKAKLALPKDLSITPIKYQSSLGNTDDVLGSRPKLTLFPNNVHGTPKVSDMFDDIVERLPSFEDLRDKMRSNTQDLLNTPSFLDSFKDNFDLSDIKYHAENSAKNIQQRLKAAGNDLDIRNPMISSHSILETIAEKHEDFNDKLKAVHIDFNDRLESMRNSLINPPYLRNDKKISNIRSFSDSNNNSKDRPLLLKSRSPAQVSTRNESPLRPEAKRKLKTTTSQAIDQMRFKMPAAASTPVSQTIEVPKLKVTPTKSFTPIIKDATIFKSAIKSTELPAVGTSTILDKQAINPFKNSKIKVSFSTTPRPMQSLKPILTSTVTPISRLKSYAREKVITDVSRNNLNRSVPKLRDSIGALSETEPLAMLASEIDENDTLEDTRNLNRSQPGPGATTNPFLAKVKEAVSARLSKANTANKASLSNKIDNRPSNSDMLRSATENLEINTEEPLKENVSYRCKMVCTRE